MTDLLALSCKQRCTLLVCQKGVVGNTGDTLTGGVGHFPEAVYQKGESGKEVRSAKCNQAKRRL